MLKMKILLANPRGFCAGVDRAINIVEKALEKYGKPIYVRHEIVHNKHVVADLKAKGAVFVQELDEIPDDSRVIFSAHGVPRSVHIQAKQRALHAIDAACPLVMKVHRQAKQYKELGYSCILIGHAGHPEVIGTMGQLDQGDVVLVETVADVAKLSFNGDTKLAYLTQTTLSVDETKDIILALKAKFPHIEYPAKEDICYATTNRQQAVKSMAKMCDAFFIIGSPNSSNSCRLVEVAKNYGCDKAMLIPSVEDINIPWLAGVKTLGITAGASAPEALVQQVISHIPHTILENWLEKEENIVFALPRELRS
jgi:4-hydroxy-3-methylbut-2-enyl diphosphate reductase